MNVHYKHPIATQMRGRRLIQTNVPATARLAVDGALGRPTVADIRALAAGYLAMAEHNKGLVEANAALGRENARLVQLVAELREAVREPVDPSTLKEKA